MVDISLYRQMQFDSSPNVDLGLAFEVIYTLNDESSRLGGGIGYTGPTDCDPGTACIEIHKCE